MERPPEDAAGRVLEFLDGRADGLVRASRVRHGLTRFANSHIHQHVGEDTVTVDLKVSRSGRIAAASTTRIDDDGLRALVERALALADQSPVDPDDPGTAPPAPLRYRTQPAPSTVAATGDARAEVVGGFIEAAADLNAAGYCETIHTDAALATTAGQRVTAATGRATIDGIHRTASSAGSGHATATGLDVLDGAVLGARAADLARRGADPIDLEPGRFPVVLAPEAVATLAVFLGLYGFNAKAVAEQRSFVRLGEQQFDPALSITDDPTDPRSVGAPFDAEGTPRDRLELIADGVSRALVHDRRTGAAADTGSTGHHVPGSDTLGPVPTDLVVAPGDSTPDDLVAGIDHGLYVTAFNYCRVLDPKTLVVTGLTRNGTFLIRDGAIAEPVGNLRFTQSFVAAAGPGRVRGVGNDDRYADSEFGPGFAIAPSLALDDWAFTGNARG